MITVHPQYVVDENQQCQAVLLPSTEWERILAELDELDDIRADDEAKSGSTDFIAFPQALWEIKEGSIRIN